MNSTKPLSRKQKIIGGLAALGAAIGAYELYEHLIYVTTDNAQVEAHAVMLAPKVGGYIAEVKVREGQKVKRGDVLIEIDPRDYDNTLRQIRGELTSTEARRRDAEKNFRRLQELLAKGAVSQQQFDTSTASYAEVKAKHDAISAQVAQAELNLENTRITAPSDGFVAKKSAERGQLASPGVPLIGFVDAEERWVTANLKETEVEAVRAGKAVDVEVDAVSGRTFKGQVESISSATGATFTLLPPDNATGNFTKVVQRIPVKVKLIELSEADIAVLRAGLSAYVKIHKH